MPQTKLLLDTNAYLRLAYSIHPLLFVSFGKEEFTLYLIKDFQKEFERQQRLKRKFPWVNDEKFKKNRCKYLTLSKQNIKDINLAETYIWEQNINNGYGASPVDVRALSAGYVLDIPVITDDKNMIDLAKSMNIKVMRIMSLLIKMHEANHIDKTKIKELVGWLSYTNDLPYKTFLEEVLETFGIDISGF